MKTGAEGGQEQRQNFEKIPQPAAIVNSLTDEDFGRYQSSYLLWQGEVKKSSGS